MQIKQGCTLAHATFDYCIPFLTHVQGGLDTLKSVLVCLLVLFALYSGYHLQVVLVVLFLVQV